MLQGRYGEPSGGGSPGRVPGLGPSELQQRLGVRAGRRGFRLAALESQSRCPPPAKSPASPSPASRTRPSPFRRSPGPRSALLVAGIGLWVGLDRADLTASGRGGSRRWSTRSPPTCCSPSRTTPATTPPRAQAAQRPGWGGWPTPFFAPHASFPTWRFIHMQHHRFTNHDDGSDPDHYTMRGPGWQRPLRWVTDRPLLHGLLPAEARKRAARRSRSSRVPC